MRFLTQDLRTGAVRAVEGPSPAPAARSVVVQTLASLVSAGTERMLVDFGRANLLDKARKQPQRVREVVDRARAEGIAETVDAVRSKLAQPLPLGYANAGVVLEVGSGVRGIREGDLVASNGGHAEIVSVPATMTASAPDGVKADEACFATVGSVGLEGIRLAGCQLGERFIVSGLGLIGLVTVQLLRAQGCAVLGIDPDPSRRALAESFGADTVGPGTEAEDAAAALSRGRGVDGVLVCASTASSEPIRSAARSCRERGRIVLVGVTGLELDRTELYEKELSLQVSRAYGPGRYDPTYEAGADYPFGFVRWTAGRNMEAVLDLMASGQIDVASLISHRFAFDDASAAYDALVEDPASLGIVLEYPDAPMPVARRVTTTSRPRATRTKPVADGIAVIGAGNFATRTLLPAIAAAGGRVAVVAARSGVSAGIAAPAGARTTTDLDSIFEDDRIGSVFVATRHDSHASLAIAALEAGKAIYVEKPLALTDDELDEIAAARDRSDGDGGAPVLTVGFNRRFAPITQRMHALARSLRAPKAISITVNAGAIPADHWVHDPEIGGGRVLGEGCHFIDLARHLAGAPIADLSTRYLATATDDSAVLTLSFEDGSLATVSYLANGSARFPKERIELFAAGRVLVNDNFRVLRAYGWPGVRTSRARRQDKGHEASVAAFLEAARGAAAPIPFDEILEASRAAIAASRPSRDA